MKEFSRCPSCGCVVDENLSGHHSAADCSILKYAERHSAEAKAEALMEAAGRAVEYVFFEGDNDPVDENGFNAPMISSDGLRAAILADQAPEAGKVEGPQVGDWVAYRWASKVDMRWYAMRWDEQCASQPEWFSAVVVIERRADHERRIQEGK